SSTSVIGWSQLGVVRSDARFVEGLRLKEKSEVQEIDEPYTLIHGKRSACRAQARQQSFLFENADGKQMGVTFRVANDGVAFRYTFPGKSDGPVEVIEELTSFAVPAAGRAWLTPYDEPTKYTPAYERYYENVAIGSDSETAQGWAFPALFRLPNDAGWVLLTESAVDGSYCGSRLAQKSPKGVYRLRIPDSGEGLGQGDVHPSGELPWTLPWRVVMVAPSLAGIVESTLVTDLAPPSEVKDTSWVKPGRASWSWWSDHDSPQDYNKMVEFIDLASEMGWEYFLVDANWTLMDNGDVRKLAQYAAEKNVGLWLWYNSGGEHNVVTEKPRGCMKATELRKFEFDLLMKWGIKGVKIDFFQSDKQNIMQQYEGILSDAAQAKILINFHGCTLPRGWQRTWPHLLSMEAVRGAECYTFAKEYPQRAPELNTVLPFTRNAVGPMDYTPCTLSDDKYPHITTNAHELALPVVFESGIVHFADRVSAYRGLPEAAKEFLRALPAAWDDTRFVAGEPGQLAAIARRKGDQWYVGVVSAQKESEPLTLAMPFLGEGEYQGTVIADGKQPRQLAITKIDVRKGDELDLKLLPFGGAVLHLVPKK
ncbi:MAG: glycoside hydrolase family 97 catalytic domain-containing protein, partial [Planctomycetota bacterium]